MFCYKCYFFGGVIATLQFSIFLFIVSNVEGKLQIVERTDLSTCKLTQLGLEYRGSVMTTSSDIRCQSWTAEQPLHKISSDITDLGFPERNMKLAKNYCRNPTKDSRGPWCYTLEPTLIDDECNIPLCNFGECRISGMGAEYGGSSSISLSGKKCKSWGDKHRLADGKTPKFANKHFSDSSRNKAKNFCRNPDDSMGGPWCYVEEETYETVQKEYCDVPFCDDQDCLAYVNNASAYSILTEFNSTYGSITFWIKLWNPNDEQNGEARILLSVLPIPTSAQRVAQNWRGGVEFLISNSGTGQVYPIIDNTDLENTPEILIGSKWTGFTLTWAGGFISLARKGISKPIFMGEYKKKNTISSLYPESFLYYGVTGTGILWSTEYCQDYCEVHTTFGIEFIKIWPVQQNNNTYDVQFHVRANRNIAIRLYQSPAVPFPSITLVIGDADVMSVIYQETEKSMKQYLKDVSSKGFLNFWEWKEFTISMMGPHLRVFSQQAYGYEEILYINHNLFGTLRWFSVGSKHNIAHWTFFCLPDELHAVEEPSPPNCISDVTDHTYAGSQWIGANDAPCIPWISDEVPENEKVDNRFVDGLALKALNKCRNPSRDPNGPYCYVITVPQASSVSKQYCSIRSCRSSECRVAGTANDYIGTLSVTRSGRTCVKWVNDLDFTYISNADFIEGDTAPVQQSNLAKSWKRPVRETEAPFVRLKKPKPTTTTTVPTVKSPRPTDRIYYNDSLYPEYSAKNASNYCRDPSRNIAGTWCYTTDPLVQQDLCNVRDCEKPEECTFLVKGHGNGRRLYVFPEYRSEGLHFSLKAWEPDYPDSITFVFTADDGLKSRYILKIGALDNEQVLLYYQSEKEEIVLVKKKTLPHLLYLGKWSSFIIRIPRGEILVYYQGAPNPLFEWKHPEPAKAFLPIYYYYNSEIGHAIGVAFNCNSRCHIEKTETDRHTRILPISAWSKHEVLFPDSLTLMLRAKGVILLPLFMFPVTPGFYMLNIGEFDRWIFFSKNTYPNVRIYHKQKSPIPLFTIDSWTNITVKWTGRTIDVLCNETGVFHYVHRTPLLFYFFSLSVESGGWATWSANCIPTDIDGPALDGGWSEWGPWACSASCNGGIGTRTRVCNSPEPNIRGEPCIGPNVMTGRCNMIICGDITEDTVTLVRRRIRRNQTALTIEEYKAVEISSDSDIIELILNESPESKIRWSHNGIFIRKEKDRIEIKDHNIMINRAVLNDSGVYTITLHRIDGTYMILKVISLVVIPNKENIVIRETFPISVICNCISMGYVYADLEIFWVINEEVWKNYGITLPIAVNVDYIPQINKSHEGLWKCIIQQNDLNFQWTTNAIFIKVLSPPNWRTYLMEDKLTRPIFGWMPNENFVAVSVLIIFLLSTGCIIIGFISFVRFRESLKIEGPPVTKGKIRYEPLRTTEQVPENPSQLTIKQKDSPYDKNNAQKNHKSNEKIKRNS